MVEFSAPDLEPARAKRLEWLVASGNGAYSSSTIIGMNSRKYHGLLVAPLTGAANRHVMLSKLEETVAIGGAQFPLSTNSYPGVIYPTGYRLQTGFSFSDHPVFSYSLNGARLEKSVRMIHGKSAVAVSYRLHSGQEAKLSVRPLLAPRPIHSDQGNADAPFQHDRFGFGIKSPAQMRVCCSSGGFSPSPQKYFNLSYEVEKERGYSSTETLFSPGEFSATLSRGEELHLVASLEGLSPSEALESLDRQSLRLKHLAESYCRATGLERTDFSDALLLAADSFLNVTEQHKGICAGFHWFSDWGRDSMISLPGLLLCTGRHALAREILASHARMMQDGLLPNFIDENETPHYTSADSSLWFLNAVRHYLDATGDENFVREHLWRHIRSAMASYVQGNHLVRMDSDCLLRVLEPASTWMDAKVNGGAVTPRRGKPVEVNALWYSSLHMIKGLAEKFGDRRTASLAGPIAEAAGASFQKFVSHEGGLFDVLEPNDASVRPNQIFAVALPHSPLNGLQQRHVFNLVRSRLYTPLGLRTLSPEDKRCHETYRGGPEQRDEAYHQGIIWPWLLGAFYDAQLSVYPGSERQVLSALRPFAEKMGEGCVGTLPELYEPATGNPAGAVSQAWSVAEVLRIYTKVKKAAAREIRPAMRAPGMILR